MTVPLHLYMLSSGSDERFGGSTLAHGAGVYTLSVNKEKAHLYVVLKENSKYTLPLWPPVLPTDQICTVTTTGTHEQKP